MSLTFKIFFESSIPDIIDHNLNDHNKKWKLKIKNKKLETLLLTFDLLKIFIKVFTSKACEHSSYKFCDETEWKYLQNVN